MTSLQGFGSAAWPETWGSRAWTWIERTVRRAAWSIGKVAALVALTGVVLGSASVMVRSSGSGEHAPSGSAAWIEVNRPIQLYGLTGTEFSRLPLSYHARRHVTGGGREDVLTFGNLQFDEPHLRLSLYRTGSESTEPLSLQADLDRLRPDHGQSLPPIGGSAVFATRFGPFEAAEFRFVNDRTATSCLGFRSTLPQDTILRISGFICGAADRPIGRDALGCVIDRIDLDSAGDDTALRNLFVQSERRRGRDCSPSRLKAAGAKTTWLEAGGSLPPLKGLLGPAGTWR